MSFNSVFLISKYVRIQFANEIEQSRFSAGSVRSEVKQEIHFTCHERMLSLTFNASLRMGSSIGFSTALIDCEAELLLTHPSPESLLTCRTDGAAFKPLNVCTNTSQVSE
jgi:hypothetical protein